MSIASHLLPKNRIISYVPDASKYFDVIGLEGFCSKVSTWIDDHIYCNRFLKMPPFKELVDLYYAKLYHFALSLVKNKDDAFDLTQYTFERWGQKGHLLRDSSKVKTWLFTTLYRKFVDNYRKTKLNTHAEIEKHANELVVDNVSIYQKIDSIIALEALSKLRDIYREPLALFYLESCSYKEISEILDVPCGTVMSRLARGKALLHSELVKSPITPGLK